MTGGATTVGAGPVSRALGSFFFSSAAVGPTNNALAARAARIRIDIRFLRDSGPEGEPLREVVRGIAKGGKTCQWRPERAGPGWLGDVARRPETGLYGPPGVLRPRKSKRKRKRKRRKRIRSKWRKAQPTTFSRSIGAARRSSS